MLATLFVLCHSFLVCHSQSIDSLLFGDEAFPALFQVFWSCLLAGVGVGLLFWSCCFPFVWINFCSTGLWGLRDSIYVLLSNLSATIIIDVFTATFPFVVCSFLFLFIFVSCAFIAVLRCFLLSLILLYCFFLLVPVCFPFSNNSDYPFSSFWSLLARVSIASSSLLLVYACFSSHSLSFIFIMVN